MQTNINKRTSFVNFVLLGLLCLSFASANAQQCNQDADNFVLNARVQHSSFNAGAYPSVWTQAHQIRSMVEIHRGFPNSEALDKLAIGVDHIINRTGAAHGLIDDVRGTLSPAWGTRHYTCGTNYYTAAVHTGMLSYPVAYFAKAVLTNPLKHSRHLGAISEALAAAEKAVDFHSDEFVLLNGDWVYAHPKNIAMLGSVSCDGVSRDYTSLANKALPFNMMIAMGLSHIELSEAFALPGNHQNLAKSASHLDKAVKIAQTFKTHLVLDSQKNSYSWNYVIDGRDEDVAHASLSIQFVVRMFKKGLIYEHSDIQRLVNTFHIVTQDRSHISSHLTKSGVRSVRWQKGIIGWADLAFFDSRVMSTINDVFFNHDGGANLHGKSLMIKLADRNFRFPLTASDYFNSHKPQNALFYSGETGLYRRTTDSVQVIDGETVTSCAEYRFQTSQTSDLTLNYAHTKQTENIDSCALGTQYCTPSGFKVFLAKNQTLPWKFAGSMPQVSSHNKYHSKILTSSVLPSYQRVLACRSAAGAARNNMALRYLGVDISQCPSPYQSISSLFISSMDGWVGNNNAYNHTRRSGNAGHSNGYLEASETLPYSKGASGFYPLSFHKSFSTNGKGLKISGWTKVSSDYSGNSRVNNRCIRIMDADNGNSVIKSECQSWTGMKSSGWTYFNYDFTPYLANVNNITIEIGAKDSWGRNWNQKLLIDDVKVDIEN